jgi:cysteine desulfurase
MIYLDYAAATPVDEKVLAAMMPYFSEDFYNPSAAYSVARQAREDYQAAKHSIAQTIGAKSAEIVMTSGATESVNLAFAVIARALAQSNPVENLAGSLRSARDDRGDIEGDGRVVITTAIEHPAVLECAKAAGATILSVDEQGRLNLDELRKNITDETRLISVGYANNELGTVQNIKEIAAICRLERQRRAERGLGVPLVFHTDASQAVGYLDINVARLGVDMMTLNSGKCYGPKGVGLLYVRAGTSLSPIIRGGGQEMGLRSGTENVAGVIGFAKALEIAEKKRKSESKRLELLRNDLEKHLVTVIARALARSNPVENLAGSLRSARDDKVIINSKSKHRLPNILNFSLPGLDGERLVFALDQRGVAVATGSACAANKGGGSHVLTAIGLSKAEADGSLRISLGRGTTQVEIDEFRKILTEAIEQELTIVR